MRQNIFRATIAVFGAALAYSYAALAADAPPKPPSQICIGEACVSDPPTGSDGIKWHPGHYMQIRARHRKPEVELPYLDAIANESAIAGVLVTWLWRNLEPKKGVYDFSSIDTYLNRLKSLPKRKQLIIRIEDRAYSTSTSSTVPDYLKTESIYNGGEVAQNNGVAARIWEAPVMDRLIALYKALGVRYDADPYVEGIDGEETAYLFSSAHPAPSSYSPGALLTQLKRHITATRSEWKRSHVLVGANYLGSDSQMEDLIKHSMANHAMVGGPDTWTRAWVESGKRALQSDMIVRGERGSGRDYRGVIAIKSEMQTTEMGGYIATFTPTELYDVAYNIMRANYILWDRNDYAGGVEQKWATGILPLIRSVNGKVHTQCPSSFQGRCDTN